MPTAFAPVHKFGPLSRFLADDHVRLDALLQRAVASPDKIDRATYDQFRAGLLKHIGMEEKILLPEAQCLRDGEPLPIAAKLRLDHGALAALLMLTPRPPILAALRAILAAHNQLEEGPGGLYETCEQLAGSEADALLARLRAASDVAVSPLSDDSHVMNVARRVLARAGYRLDDDSVKDGEVTASR